MDTKAEGELWNVFHDGTIAFAEGKLGDTVRVNVEIEYLGEMFEEPGTSFFVELAACESLSFTALDSTETIASLQEISSLDLEILSAAEDSGPILKVLCLGGEVNVGAQVVVVEPSTGAVRLEQWLIPREDHVSRSRDEIRYISFNQNSSAVVVQICTRQSPRCLGPTAIPVPPSGTGA